MNNYIKDEKILNKKIILNISEKDKEEYLLKDLKVVGIENTEFDRFVGGDNLFNFILKFNNKNNTIIKVYSTYHDSDCIKNFNIILDNDNDFLIDRTINILKTNTWTIEKSGSIKTGEKIEKDRLALRVVFFNNNIDEKINCKINIFETTIQEKEMLDKLYDVVRYNDNKL